MVQSYTLTKGDKILADKMAEIRAADWYDNSAYGYSPYQVHLMGSKAEIAVGCMFQLPIDISDRDYGDECDFRVSVDDDVGTLDVKSTSTENGELMVRADTTTNDYYLLTHIDGYEGTEVTILGWADTEQVKRGGTVEMPNDGHENYIVQCSELKSVPQIERV